MERAAFLIEPSDRRIDCMLNPESLIVQRRSSLHAERGGAISGHGVSDDLLRCTGGGATEISLDLLFDTELAALGADAGQDVRGWTRPLWELTENTDGHGAYGAPRAARFLFGKTWNLRVMVLAASERFGSFTATGVPKRSWLRLLLRRVAEESLRPQPVAPLGEGGIPDVLEPSPVTPIEGGPLLDELFELGPQGGERADQLAFRLFGDSTRWRELEQFTSGRSLDELLTSTSEVAR